MAEMEYVIGETLLAPDEIRRDSRDPETVRLYLKWYDDLPVGSKWVLVAVKMINGDAYVVTSFTFSRSIDNEILWTRSNQ